MASNRFKELNSYDAGEDLPFSNFVSLAEEISLISEVLVGVRATQAEVQGEFDLLLANLAEVDVEADDLYRSFVKLRALIIDSVTGELEAFAHQQLTIADRAFQQLLQASLSYQFARDAAERARQPIDHKRLLDMLIDEKEDKYIELLEGTRARIAVIDGYIKAIASALDDDFQVQFYDPAFREIRQSGRSRDVQFGQIETTTVLANNRGFAKVEPQAIMEFDLPKRDILITEAMQGAKALVNDYGALLTDPTFLAATKLLSGQPTSTMAQGTLGGGASAVRNVLPGLPRADDEEVLSQAGPGQRRIRLGPGGADPRPGDLQVRDGHRLRDPAGHRSRTASRSSSTSTTSTRPTSASRSGPTRSTSAGSSGTTSTPTCN